MNIWRAFRSAMVRFWGASTLSNPNRWMPMGTFALPATDSESGIEITAESALACSAVFACVRVLSETPATLPLILYERTADGGKDRLKNVPLYRLLHDRPNRWQTRFEWVEMGMSHLLLRGNFYNRIVWDQSGEIVELLPLHPDQTWPELQNGQLRYWTRTKEGVDELVPEENMFHVRGMSSDGVTGITPLQYARNAIGLALATETHGSRLFRNAAQPRLLLKHPGEMSTGAQERFKVSWQNMYAGVYNAGKTAILEEGMSVEKLGMSNEDAQFIEGRKFQTNDIARFFNVPLHLIQDYERATFSNVEHLAISAVTHTFLPWLTRWEQAINSRLIPRSLESRDVFAEFLVDSLLRGDTTTRYVAYASAITNGWMNRNEVRQRENLNPVEGLDEFFTALNMGKASENVDEPQDVEQATLLQWIGDAADRVLRAEEREPDRDEQKRHDYVLRTFKPILGDQAGGLAVAYWSMESRNPAERRAWLVANCARLRNGRTH